MLRESGVKEETLVGLTHGAICRTFDIAIGRSGRSAEEGLAGEYEFDPYARESAP
jgi:hypothetical protein